MSHVLVRSSLAAAVALATVKAALGAETILLQDDFESYADTAAMNAVWNANAGNTSTLNTTLPGPTEGSTTKSLNNTPTASNQHAARSITPTAPTAEQAILWQFDYFWDGTGNKRMTGGLRVATASGNNSGILEMGFYNASYNPFASTPDLNVNASGFSARTVLVPGAGTLPELTNHGGANSGGWRIMPNADDTAVFSTTGKANTWFTLAALIETNKITYTIDHLRDGTIDSTYVATTETLNLSETLFDTVRLGTGLTSGGGGADFDNVLVKTVSLATAVAGDVNGDGVVNLGDINYVTARWLNTGAQGDANGDGVVNLGDINYITARWLNTSSPTGVSVAALAAVPEPASLGLLGLAAIGLGARRRSQA